MADAQARLITGITGQDGSYLAELLLAKGYEVVGVVRRTSHHSYERIEHLLDRIEIVPADLLDQHSLTVALQETQPDEVYNLAAQSLRAHLLDPAGADRRVHRPRRDPHPRGDPPGPPARPGSTRPVELGDVRQGARDAPDRRRRRSTRARPTASPRSTATGSP